MFFRKVITKKDGREYRYLKLLENFREGGRTRHSVVANLGNLDSFTPEKFQALIESLMRIAESELHRELVVEELPECASVAAESFRKLWRQLKLPKLINSLAPKVNGIEPSLLAEAMVLGIITRPYADLAVEKVYRDLPVPELVSKNIEGTAFYKLLETLGNSKLLVEEHLSAVYHNETGDNSKLLFINLGCGTYEGSRCELSHYGQTYLVRAYNQPLLIALLINESGWPLGVRVLWQTENNTSDLPELLHQSMPQCRSQKYVAVFDERCALGGEWFKQLQSQSESGYYIALKKPQNLMQLPVSAFEMSHYENFFTRVQPDLWIKQVEAKDYNYILCYHPDNRTDEHLGQRLASALEELEKIKSFIAANRLRRKKAVVGRVAEVLGRYGCSEYFTYNYNNSSHQLEYRIKQEAIDEYKLVRDTWLIKTNLDHLPPDEIVRRCLAINGMEGIFRTVRDFTKIPWLPQLEKSSLQMVIEGHVIIRLLAFLICHLYEHQLTNPGEKGGCNKHG